MSGLHWRDLQVGDATPLIGVVEQKALVGFHPLRDPLRVIETVDPDDEFARAKLSNRLSDDAI